MRNIRYIAVLLSLLIALPINGAESDNQQTTGSSGTVKSYSFALLKTLGQCGKTTVYGIHRLIGYLEDHPIMVCATAVSLYALYINTFIEAHQIYLSSLYNLFNQSPAKNNFVVSHL